MNQDLIIEILSYLPFKDKVKSSLVCKEWYQLNKYIYTKQPINLEYNNLKTKKFEYWSKGKIFDINLYIREIDEFEIATNFLHRICLLNLYRNKLNIFPNFIKSIINLHHLYITSNLIEYIPDSIQHLT